MSTGRDEMETKAFPSGGGCAPHRDDEPTLADYVAIIWRRRKLVLTCMVVAAVAAVVTHFALPKKYQATALILPPQGEDSTGGMAAKLAGLADSLPITGMLGIKNPTERYVGILKSQRVADAIIDRFGLMEKYETEYRIDARKKLGKRSEFEAADGDLINITVTDTDPRVAAEMANAYIEVLGTIDRQLSVGKAGRERLFLDERVAEVEKGLKADQEAFKIFQEKHHIVRVDEGLQATATVMAELEARRMAKEIEVQVMETVYSKTNPQVEMARAEMKKLEEKLKEVSMHGVRVSSSSPPSALHPPPSDSTAAPSQWLFPAIEKVPALALEQIDLERRLRLHAELYKLLVTQREMARINEAKENSSVQVVAAATAPDRPYRKFGGMMLVAFALILSCTLGSLLAIALERVQRMSGSSGISHPQ